MGTQQLLLIVLGVIIVGIAIAVGITIFNNQAYNSNQQAVASELTNYAAMVNQWWKTPKSQGGAGKIMPVPAEGEGTAADIVATWIGFHGVDTGATDDDGNEITMTNAIQTEAGIYRVKSAAGTTVVLTGVGNEKKGTLYPHVKATIDLTTGKVTSEISANASAVPL